MRHDNPLSIIRKTAKDVSRKRRVKRVKQLTGAATAYRRLLRAQAIERQGGKCFWCERDFVPSDRKRRATLEHLLEQSRGGVGAGDTGRRHPVCGGKPAECVRLPAHGVAAAGVEFTTRSPGPGAGHRLHTHPRAPAGTGYLRVGVEWHPRRSFSRCNPFAPGPLLAGLFLGG